MIKSPRPFLLIVLLLCLHSSAPWCLKDTFSLGSKIKSVDYSSSSTLYAVGLDSNDIKIFDAVSHVEMFSYTSGNKPNSMKFNHETTKLASGEDSKLVIIDLTTSPYTTQAPIATHDINDLDWNDDSSKLVTCGEDKRIKVWDSTTWGTPITLGFDPCDAIKSCSFIPTTNDVLIGCNNGELHTIHSSTSYTTRTNKGDFGSKINDICYRTGSSSVFIFAEEADEFTISPSTVIPLDSTKSYTCSYSPTNAFFMVSGENGDVFIYNGTSQGNNLLQTFDNTDSKIRSSAFSGDGDNLIAGDQDGTLYLYSRVCVTCLFGYYLDYVTLSCEFCGNAIPGCGVCPNSAYCTNCIQGFYISPDSTSCLPCDGVLTGCGACVDDTTCLFCMSGYYLDGTECSACGSAMPGCLLCSDANTCLQCHSDFYLATNDCLPCSDVPHCLRCNSTIFCIECELGYFVDTNDLCTLCNPGCLVCNSTGYCHECTIGYYSVAGVCTQCGSGCLACNNTAFCFDCESGMVLAGGACTDCPAQCVTCDASSNCLTCYPGFFLNSNNCDMCSQGCETCNTSVICFSCIEGYYFEEGTNTCSECHTNFPHCLSCDNQTCIQCFVGSYLDSGDSTCKPCGEAMHGCEICSSEINCLHCVNSHFLDGVDLANNSCLPCLTGCITCNAETDCDNCAPEFYLLNDNATCALCLFPCLTCSSDVTCLSCPIGYYLDGGDDTCKSCAENTTGCVACLVVPVDGFVCTNCGIGYYLETDDTCQLCASGCVTCNSSAECLSCPLGYYLTNTLTCQVCSPDCAECSSDGLCLSCLIGTYLNSTNSCVPCTEVGCLTCLDDSTCLTCINGYYVNGSSLCQLCSQSIDDCLECDGIFCFLCTYGYVLDSATNTSCLACSQITGCLNCADLSTCLVCLSGFYLESDNSCQTCGEGCINCEDALVCLQCSIGYYLDSGDNTCKLCKNNLDGCDACNDDGTLCLECNIGFYLNNATDLCQLCHLSLQGCLLCNASDSCVSCMGGYYLSASACTECSIVPGCLLCDNSSFCITCKGGYYEDGLGNCLFCDTNVLGCEQCSDFDTCVKCLNGYYLTGETCTLCETTIPGCIFCNDFDHCLQCEGGYFLNSGNLCEACSAEGCEICAEDDSSACITCNGQYFMSSPGLCTKCRLGISSCLSCTNSSVCEQCDVGYYFDGAACELCSQAMNGCSICSDASNCLDCKSLYFVNSSSQCQLCQQPLLGCAFCTNNSICLSCQSGFFRNASNLCEPCTNITGCLICKDSIECIYCDTSYYLSTPTCNPCSIIPGCYSCISDLVCTSCLGGYTLNDANTCEEIDLQAATSDVEELVLKTFYVDDNTLKHELYAIDMVYTQVDVDWQAEITLSIMSNDGTVLELTIISVEWGSNDYTLIIYTNNPLNIDSNDLKMPFTRLLLQDEPRNLQASLELNSQTQLSMSETAKNQILPNYAHAGALTVSYDLDNSEFYASYVTYHRNFLLEIIGVIFVIVLYIKYSIKALKTVPESLNHGNIIGHILAFKVGALLLFPTFMEYIQFCSGFMVADLPFLNKTFGEALSDSRDLSPTPYFIFFINMNLGSMYLLACIAIILLSLITYVVGRSCNNNFKMWAYFRFLYAFFIFGVVFAGCGSLQGAILNPVEELSVNGIFYIFGIVLYFGALCEVLFRLYTNVVHSFWRIRIFVKATLLSLSHFSPIYLVSAAVLIDLILVAIQYKICKYPPRFARWWIFANITVNLSLLLLIYLPVIQLSLITISILLLLVVIAEGVMHYKETRKDNDDLRMPIEQVETLKQEEKGFGGRIDTSEKDIAINNDQFATLYVEDDDQYRPFEPIKKTRERNYKKMRDEIKQNMLKEGNNKKMPGNDDSQSFTFTMEESSQISDN